jgi:hypothetical protein
VRGTARARVGRRLRETVARPGAELRVPVGPGRGIRLEVNPGTTLHVYAGTAELELWRHLRRLATPGTVCVDVGASEGWYALLLAKLTGARTAAIEFQPDHLARLRRNLARNPALAQRVTVIEAYVSSAVDGGRGIATLDALVADGRIPAPGLLKIDVEGSELEVLHGALGLLGSVRPHVLLETHGLALERACGELLADNGYRVSVVSQRTVLREGRTTADNRWLVGRAGPGS